MHLILRNEPSKHHLLSVDVACELTMLHRNYQLAPTCVYRSTKELKVRGIMMKQMHAQFSEDDDSVQYPCKRALIDEPDR